MKKERILMMVVAVCLVFFSFIGIGFISVTGAVTAQEEAVFIFWPFLVLSVFILSFVLFYSRSLKE